MQHLNWKPLASLLSLCLLVSWLPAQPFQRLQAYGPAPSTGGYHDVVCLSDSGPNLEEVVLIGSSDDSQQRGVLSFLLKDGTISFFREITHKFGGSLEAEAICQMPSGDLIAAFWDSVNGSSHIFRVQKNGALVWKKRLPDFHVLDVVAGKRPFLMAQERIYLTGFSDPDNEIVIEALASGGTGLWAYRYDITGGYGDSYGNEIHFSASPPQLTVVGTVQSDTCPRRDLLLLQTNLAGTVTATRHYYDPGPPPYAYYEGKTLVNSPYGGSTFTLGFEYADPAFPTGNFPKPGLIDLTSTYTRLWAFYYEDNTTGFFRGDNFSMGGLDTDGDTYLISGDFQSFSRSAPSAYTLEVNRYGTGLTWTEFENLGAYPASGTGFTDLMWDEAEEAYYIGGEFTSVSDAGSWPRGSNPQSFWAVAADSTGQSDCTTQEVPWVQQLGPGEGLLSTVAYAMPVPNSSPCQLKTPTNRSVNQCGGLKQAWESPAAPAPVFEVAQLRATQQVRVDLTELPEAPGTVRLYNLQGQELAVVPVQGRHTYLSTSGLAGGVYLVTLDQGAAGRQTRKIMLP